ncbi:unnamed protein product [Somion occarium]|uniref:Nuclear pore complex NUP2/50/61 domain-containing protein n=1 Tax=Somion occarium TaxID=3059160 RepID=A0ABP1DHC1_9APHY
MKRGAEKQLSKDDDGEDEVEEIFSPGQGFKKADDSILAGRKIRSLPKRSLAGAAPALPLPVAPTPVEPAPTTGVPKFGGFSGFAATPFTFGAPSATSKPFAAPSPFGASTSPPQSAFSSAFGAPSVSTSASIATKTFASFLGQPPSQPEQKPEAEKPKEPSPPSADKVDEELKIETKYLAALRGLNASLLTAVSKAVQTDPFLDVADLLARYKELRIGVKSEYDESLKKLQSPAAASTTSKPSAPAPPVSAFGKSADSQAKTTTPPTPTSMPAPPSGFAGFSAPPSSSALAAPSGGGFVPKVDTSTSLSKASPFTFPPPSTSTTTPVPTSTSSSSSLFSFGSSSSSTSTVFGAPSSLASGPFGGPSTAPSVFSSNLFSAPEQPKGAEKEKEKPAETADIAPPAGSTSSIFSGASTFSASEKSYSSSSTFAFGATSPGKPSPFAGFGAAKSAGNIGNPVGFGFGNLSKTGEGESSSPFGPSKPSGFSFAPLPTTSKPAEKEARDESSGGSGGATPTEEPAQPLFPSTSIHDMEGEGEEDEVTTHEIRTKVFKTVKKSGGGQEWGDMGIGWSLFPHSRWPRVSCMVAGVLRLKKHKESGARRLLLRNSSTGKIVIVRINCYPWVGVEGLIRLHAELQDLHRNESYNRQESCLVRWA